jgi:hypothetical protein
MIKVSLIKKHYQVKVGAKNIVTSCDPATVTATNTDSTVLGTATVASGGTGNIPIADSVISNTTGVIDSLPATTPLTIIDSVVTLINSVPTTLSTTNVPATTNLTLTAPNSTTNVTDQNGTPLGQVTGISGATNTQSVTVPACPDLDELVDTSTNQEVFDAIVLAGKDCFVQTQLIDRYKVDGFSSLGSFGTLTGSIGASMVHNGLIYIISQNNVLIFNATTYALQTTVTGFNGAAELAISPDGTQYAVVNFTGNNVRIMNTATNTEITSFATITGPWAVCYNALGTELYISTVTATTITRYNLAGATLGTVTGFDGRMLEIRRVGLNYHVLTATGTASGSTQRVRVMDFATNTEQSSHSLGTVATIGAVSSIAIEGSSAYLCANKGTGLATTLFVYEYNLSYSLTRSENTCLNGTNLWGVSYNPAYCGSLVLPLTQVGTAINLLV